LIYFLLCAVARGLHFFIVGSIIINMCIKYEGTEYHYGITVALEKANSGEKAKDINILMTKYMDDCPYIYGGLCLDNALYVTTHESERHYAMRDIISKIKDGTMSLEEAYAKRYPSMPFKPYKNILEENPEIREKFTQKMENSWLIDEYKELRDVLDPILENQVFGLKIADFKPRQTAESPKVNNFLAVFTSPGKQDAAFFQILYDCRDIVLATGLIYNDPRFSNCRINYSRV